MRPVERIVERFGGVRPMAAKMGCPPQTVQSWKDRGVIPARRQSDVLAAAEREGIEVGPADFFEPPVEEQPREQGDGSLSTTNRGKAA